MDDEDWKMKRLQALIDEGVFIEDPDGMLWLGDRVRGLVKDFNEDEEMKELIHKTAKDKNDASIGAWSLIYMQHVGIRSVSSGLPRACTGVELKEAVAVLMGWNEGAKANDLDEWSMQLRLR